MAEVLTGKVKQMGTTMIVPIVAESFDDADSLTTKQKVISFAKSKNAQFGIKQILIKRARTEQDGIDETLFPKDKFKTYAEWEMLSGFSSW